MTPGEDRDKRDETINFVERVYLHKLYERHNIDLHEPEKRREFLKKRLGLEEQAYNVNPSNNIQEEVIELERMVIKEELR